MNPSLQLGLELLSRTAARHAGLLDRLTPLARELAAQPHGATIADVREMAMARGLLTGHEQGRSLSCLGALMQRAGLVATPHYRRSMIRQAHGNLGRVWRLVP